MDYRNNADKISSFIPGVSYGQCIDVDNNQAIATPLFTLQQFKEEYGRIDTTEENALISSLIITAQRMCEQFTGINFSARTVVATIDNCNGGVYLPYGPVGDVAGVTDIDGNAIPSTGYKLLGNQFKSILWPTQTLIFTYTGGYVTCPNELVNAVKAQTMFLYENRGDSTAGMSPLASLILKPLARV